MSLRDEYNAADEAERRARQEKERLWKLLRRENQAADLDRGEGTLERPVTWLGDIGSFCDDLDYHTIRLGRAIYGEFNGCRIVTNPTLKENAIALDAFNQWRDHFRATR
jgi:hypothetical protein